jgi:mannosyltransferase
MQFDVLLWRSWMDGQYRRVVRMWTVGLALISMRVRGVSVGRVLGRGDHPIPVSPAAPVAARGLAESRSAHGAEGAAVSWPGTRVGVLERLDEPTAMLRTVPARATDLWDDLLHLADRVPDDSIETPVRRWAHSLIPAALTCLLAAIGLGRPSLWTDELATWGMATTPWSEFWPVLRYVDAVLAPYYVLMHVWVDVFGDSDVSLRTPSVLAMTAAAGLIGAIGNRLSGRSAGLLAGTVFAFLASTSRFAAEVRPYAFAVLAACVATWLLVRAWDRPTFVRWAAYALALAVLGWLHLVAILLVAAHAWTVVAWKRGVWRPFAVAAAAGMASTIAVVMYGMDQRHQVAYIPRVGVDTFVPYGEVLFGTVAVTIVLVVLGMFGLPLRFPTAVFAAWAVLPAVALIGVSLFLPMFLPRYLVYTTPGWALLAGVTLARFRPAWAIAATVLLAALAAPTQLHLRGPGGHGQDTRELATVVGSGVRLGDGIVYADDEPVGSWTARDSIAHYLPAAYRPRDVLALQPQRTGGRLLATECPDISACLNGNQRLWVVRTAVLSDPLAGLGQSKEDLLRTQYELDQVWYPSGLTVALLERKATST